MVIFVSNRYAACNSRLWGSFAGLSNSNDSLGTFQKITSYCISQSRMVQCQIMDFWRSNALHPSCRVRIINTVLYGDRVVFLVETTDWEYTCSMCIRLEPNPFSLRVSWPLSFPTSQNAQGHQRDTIHSNTRVWYYPQNTSRIQQATNNRISEWRVVAKMSQMSQPSYSVIVFETRSCWGCWRCSMIMLRSPRLCICCPRSAPCWWKLINCFLLACLWTVATFR